MVVGRSALLMGILLLPLPGYAVTVTGSGVVLANDGFALVLAGDPTLYGFGYEEGVADQLPANPAFALYEGLPLLFVSVLAGPFGFRDIDCVASEITVNDGSPSDQNDFVLVRGIGCLDDFGNPISDLVMNLSDSSRTSITGDALTPALFDLSLYDDTVIRVRGCNGFPCSDVDFDFEFFGSIDALTAPEPASAGAAALVALYGWTRIKRKRTPAR